MNQPMMPARRAGWDVERMLEGSDALLDIDKMAEQIGKLAGGVDYTPTDEVALMLYAISVGQRDALDWLLDLTIRAPYPHVDGDFQKAALAAAKHQARAGVGETIVAAIARGKELYDQKKDQTHA